MGFKRKGETRNASHPVGAGCCGERGDRPERLTCTGSDREVGEIGELLSSVASQSLAPPERTANGYRLHLAPSEDVARMLREFARREKACCSFLDFEIEERAQEICMDVVGPPEANEILNLCFAVVTSATPSLSSATDGR
jgi:hypothetical protein